MIQILSNETSEKIAAGEVVERPASVIKELTENAIDSGADEIFVDLENGGHSLIKITDNGCGISKDELPIAIQRFATSKITKFEDLFSINTLGFRGEALPSIGAISRLEIVSKKRDEDFAYMIIVEGGQVIDTREASGSDGTTVKVTNLFYNTPARKKFQKTPSNEISHIVKYLSAMAVLRRDIHFRLKNNGRIIFDYPVAMNKKDCLKKIWGIPSTDVMKSLSSSCPSAKLTGIICSPDVDRSSRNEIMFCVNGRIIKNTQLIQAVIEGYSPFLATKKYPLVFLSMDIDPNTIDVNVHPAKTEIHFEEQQKIFGFVKHVINETVKSFRDPEFSYTAETENGEIYDTITGEIKEKSIDDFENEKKIYYQPIQKVTKNKVTTYLNSMLKPAETVNIQDFIDDEEKRFSKEQQEKVEIVEENKNNTDNIEYIEQKTEKKIENKNEFIFENNYNFIPLTQIFDTYIAGEFNGEFILIDQHAAHEKIIYESLNSTGNKGNIQFLLIPEILELSSDKTEITKKYLDYFKEIGFDIADFGNNTFKITAVPFFIEQREIKSFIDDIITSIIEETQNSQIIPLENLRHMVACKSAIKANKKLSFDEMKSLFAKLMTLKEPFFCPHGRPVIHKFTKYELEKLFKRKK